MSEPSERSPVSGDAPTETPSRAGTEMSDRTAAPGDLGVAPTGLGPAAGSASHPSAPAALGRYEVLGELGAGGMGVVYRGRDPTLGRALAIKLIRHRTSDRDGRLRFLREAQAMARLQHVNVVPIFDVGESGEQIYLVMPLLLGGTLGAWCRAARRSWREVLERFVHAGRGLAAAHAAGMIHRDFKPDNVLLGADGEVQVADFGIARLGGDEAPARADEGGSPELTQAGALLGTPVYMAPEQLRGVATDPRADVFAFCVSLFEGLYGCRPFALGEGRGQGALDELRARIEAGDIVTPPADRAAPAELHAAVVRGLAPRPDDRWPSMAALLRELERQLAPRRAWRWPALVAAAVVIASAGVAALTLGGAHTATPTNAPAVADQPDDRLAARCDARDGAACYALAVRLVRRLEPSPDFPRAFRLALAACDLGVANGCALAATQLSQANGVTIDDRNARALAVRGCDGGSGAACTLAADLLASGIGGEIDRTGARTRLQRGCELGAAMACRLEARNLRTDLDAPDLAAADALSNRAIALARAGCTNGDPDDCRVVALMLHAGFAGVQDKARAATMLEEACAQGSGDACGDAGQLFVLGEGVQADPARGLALLRRGCSGGTPAACEAVAIVLQNGFGLPVDHAGARQVAEAQCKRGGPRQCTQLGSLYMQGIGVPQDVVQARRLYAEACDAGSGVACFIAGGHLVKTGDVEGGMARLRRSCDSDFAAGCQKLGEVALERGDDALAASALRAACRLDNAGSCAGLARLYFEGRGVERDPARGRALLENGCAGSDHASCWQLGQRLRDGNGLARDIRKALDALTRSCDQGWSKACLAAADLLTAGSDVPSDPPRAAALRKQGCDAEPRLCAPK